VDRKELENLVGESMEDMGLIETVEERECSECGCLLEDDNRGLVCRSCQRKELVL